MEVVVTAGAIRRTKLQLNCHHQQTYTQIYTGRMAEQVKSSIYNIDYS